MTSASLMAGAAFLALGGAAHCLAMCGGIAAMLGQAHGEPAPLTRTLAYHAGRITTYAGLGFWAGTIGHGAGALLPSHASHLVSRALLIVALGVAALQLLGGRRYVRVLEQLGAPLWRLVQPLAAKLLPVRSVGSAWLVGMLWGYLPCGLVYAAVGLAFAAGSGLAGGAVMTLFGLRTAPVFAIAHLVARTGVRLSDRGRWQRAMGWALAASCVWGAIRLGQELRPSPRSCCAHGAAGIQRPRESAIVLTAATISGNR